MSYSGPMQAQASQPHSPLKLLLGVVFLLCAFGIACVKLVWAARAEPATGRVVQLEASSRTRGSTVPVVEFTSADGRTHRIRGGVASSHPAYRVGDRVDVLYDLGSPDDASIDSTSELWMLPGVLGILGAIAVAVELRRRGTL